MHTTLIVPGLHGSGPTHWQSWFESVLPGCRRVVQDDWDQPDLDTWRERVIDLIDDSRGPLVLVAHSFGCLASAAAAALRADRVAAALLVAPADPRKFGVSHLLPQTALGLPCMVAASSNDPWMPLGRARYWAARWGARFHALGDLGHVNVAAGLGPWPDGLALYESLCDSTVRGIGRRPPRGTLSLASA